MTPEAHGQIDLLAWADELEGERSRVADINAERARRRGYLVFATDPEVSPDAPGYRQVFATEAKTPAQAMAKVKPIADGRRATAARVPRDRAVPGRAGGRALGGVDRRYARSDREAA